MRSVVDLLGVLSVRFRLVFARLQGHVSDDAEEGQQEQHYDDNADQVENVVQRAIPLLARLGAGSTRRFPFDACIINGEAGLMFRHDGMPARIGQVAITHAAVVQFSGAAEAGPKPLVTAHTAACVRFCKPSFRSRAFICTLTVASVLPSRRAIILLESPWTR